MYTDYYLKFTNKAEADNVLFTTETVMVEGVEETIMRPNYTAIDVIGTIYSPTGNSVVVDGNTVPEMVEVPGYHANVRHAEEALELDAYVVTVKSPVRVWA